MRVTKLSVTGEQKLLKMTAILSAPRPIQMQLQMIFGIKCSSDLFQKSN